MDREPLRGYVDEETGEFVMPATTTRARASGTSRGRTMRMSSEPVNVTPRTPSAAARFVVDTAAKARRDARAYAMRGARAAFWGTIAIPASWRFGWPFLVVASGLGAYALWQFERAYTEGHIGRSA